MSKKRKGPYAHQPAAPTPKKTQEAEESGTIVSDKFIEDVNKDARIQLVQADFEKQAALNEAGMEEEVYGAAGWLYRLITWYHKKTRGFRFKKKTYLWLLLFTGWAGGHRWYQGRRWLGLIETCLCWTGLPLVMCIQDFMEVFPIKPDEDGYIVM